MNDQTKPKATIWDISEDMAACLLYTSDAADE